MEDLRNIIENLIDEIIENLDYGDIDFSDYYSYSVNFWLDNRKKREIIENFRISLIRFIDEQINRYNPTVTVVLKKETIKEETQNIAETITNIMENLHKDNLLEVVTND